MYAVIKTGGKQERVEEGQRVAVELLAVDAGEEVSFAPILLVDGATVLATPDELAGAVVSARVVGEEKGPKVRGFQYKAKTRRPALVGAPPALHHHRGDGHHRRQQ